MPNANIGMPPAPEPAQPEMPISNGTDENVPEDIPNDLGGDGNDGNEIQSDAAKLAQKVSAANPETAKIAIKQFNSVAVKALNSDDVSDVVNGIEKAANGNGDESNNVDGESQMPMENRKISSNQLDEMIDKILNSDC